MSRNKVTIEFYTEDLLGKRHFRPIVLDEAGVVIFCGSLFEDRDTAIQEAKTWMQAIGIAQEVIHAAAVGGEEQDD